MLVLAALARYSYNDRKIMFFGPCFILVNGRRLSNLNITESFELECLAVIYAIKWFHIYLAGISFKIVTDCDSFRLTLSKQTVNPRVALFLEQYTYEIVHRPGTRMSHVDGLSRCQCFNVRSKFIRANSIDSTRSRCRYCKYSKQIREFARQTFWVAEWPSLSQR